MYDLKLPLSTESIELYITHWDIFNHYIKDLIDVEIPFQSQLRKDKNPSCRLFYYNNVLLYKDFAVKGALTCYSYVMEKYGLDFRSALEKIRRDFDLNTIEPLDVDLIKENAQKSKYQPKTFIIKPSIIRKKSRKWTTDDKDFWYGKYGINLKWLKQANIEPISYFWLTNHKIMNHMFIADKLSYSFNYYWNDNIFRRKIYQPYNKDFKWISNVDSTIVQGWDMLPKSGGNILIITSSFKDVGTIMCNCNDIYSIAPNNEETFIPEKVFQKLQTRWKHIFIWYDNDFSKLDNPGLRNAIKYSEQYNIPYLLTPDNTEKDPSDFRFKYGSNEFVNLVHSELSKYV